MKRNNLKLKSDIKSVRQEIGQVIEADRQSGVHPLNPDCSQFLGRRGRTESRAEPPTLEGTVGGVPQLPNLQQYIDLDQEEEVPPLAELRRRPELQRNVDLAASFAESR